jgi:hypothetical protein
MIEVLEKAMERVGNVRTGEYEHVDGLHPAAEAHVLRVCRHKRTENLDEGGREKDDVSNRNNAMELSGREREREYSDVYSLSLPTKRWEREAEAGYWYLCGTIFVP